MMSDHIRWVSDGRRFEWVMPRRRWFQIWPIVRHVWVIWTGFHVANHNSVWRKMGAIPTGYDEWVLYGTWNNLDCDPSTVPDPLPKGGA